MPQQAGRGSLMPFPFILEKANLNHSILCQTQGVRKNLSKYHGLNSNINSTQILSSKMYHIVLYQTMSLNFSVET